MAVLLSGGSGTRLWPLSRETYPKQFLALTGKHSLLQETALRLQALSAKSPPISVCPPLVVCNESHRFLVAEQFRTLKLKVDIVLEPVGRNTAPALTAAALLATQEGNDPVLAAAPSDHVIKNADAFCNALSEAVSLAQDEYMVTFGIVPTRAETGFGYLRAGQPLCGQAKVLEAFVEKPKLELAKQYLASGNYLWNSGIFVLRARRWLDAIGRFRPDILAAVREAVHSGRQDGEFFRLHPEAFARCPADSIDYAVMEKIAGTSKKIAVLPLDAGWSDLGSWPALWEVTETDNEGNVAYGDVYLKRVKDCLIRSEARFVAALGVEGLVVVETQDAILVAAKECAQEVREVAEYLKRLGRPQYLEHIKTHRPWGTIETIGEGERYQVKRLTLRPGACVTTQLHHHRAEHWIVVKGTARVTRGEETFLLSENQSVYIPIGVKHRLENPGQIPLELIEVRSGAYLGEDDVLRFPDC
ncbi:mannose-1-phosphate guanylyltransferase/mannose-6-phosphate isomerase [Methylothermus subterraneus]